MNEETNPTESTPPRRGRPPKVNREEKFVKVRYDGTSGWTLCYEGEEREILGPGDTKDFNLHNKYDLRSLIQIIKQINNPKGNTQSYIDKNDPVERTKYRKRFTIVGGEELIPEALRKIKYRENNSPLNTEREAILELVPDFFERKKKP